jgi:hypothetical protein
LPPQITWWAWNQHNKWSKRVDLQSSIISKVTKDKVTLTLMTTTEAIPLEIEFQKKTLQPSDLTEKIQSVFTNPNHHRYPCPMHRHQSQREGVAHLRSKRLLYAVR